MKKKSSRCPYPKCRGKLEHDGEHDVRPRKHGVPTPRWTPKLRLFLEHLNAGKSQTDAARLAYPASKTPDRLGSRLARHSLVVAARNEHIAMQKEAAQKAVEEDARNPVITRREIEGILALIARGGENDSVKVRAAVALAEIKGMKIQRSLDANKEFEGKTEEELDFFAIHGYWPEPQQRVVPGQPGAGGLASAGAAAEPAGPKR